MHGSDYAWILPDDIDFPNMTSDSWHTSDKECSRSQLSQTLDGLIIVKSHAAIVGDEISASGLVCCSYAKVKLCKVKLRFINKMLINATLN